MNEYAGVHLNLMEVVPVYLVSQSVDVNVMMYLLKNRALRDGLIDDPCLVKNCCFVVNQLHFLVKFKKATLND